MYSMGTTFIKVEHESQIDRTVCNKMDNGLILRRRRLHSSLYTMHHRHHRNMYIAKQLYRDAYLRFLGVH